MGQKMPNVLEDYELNDDGTITFNFAGITRTLKRPTLGEYRRLVEALSATRSATEGVTKINVQLDEMIGWLDTVFVTLAGEGLPRNKDDAIDEDKLPTWLITAEIAQGMIQQWQMVPNHRGGR